MTRSVAAVVAAFGLQLAVPVQAHAQTGYLCAMTAFASLDRPDGSKDSRFEIDGGPLLAADLARPGEETAEIRLTCTIQVGNRDITHAAPDSASVSGPAVQGIAVVPPTVVPVVVPPNVYLHLCTQATVGGEVRYWDNMNAVWSSSPDVGCATAISQTACCFEPYDDLGVCDPVNQALIDPEHMAERCA